MANFIINQTASEIQQILNKADSPDTIPTPNSQNLVESGGVKTYVDSQVSAGASITTNSFAPSALEDSNDGLTATDTAVPTSAAVFNAIDAATTKVAQLTAPDVASGNGVSSSTTIPFTVSSDPNNIVSVSNGVITPTSAGVYQIIWSGEFAEDDSTNSDFFRLQLKAGSSVLAQAIVNETGSYNIYEHRNLISVHNNTSLTTYSAFVQEERTTAMYYKNQTLVIIKLT
tara:strand:+ start:2113 stop:2799 length:687 start_codon:yes stop_codon:yes gene_type:complete